MKPTGIIRKLDNLGRIVLPKELLLKFGIAEKDGLEIFADEEQEQIILKKSFEKKCLKCHGASGLKEIKPGCYLCEKCIGELK